MAGSEGARDGRREAREGSYEGVEMSGRFGDVRAKASSPVAEANLEQQALDALGLHVPVYSSRQLGA